MTILTNLTALISGASAGIGEACAKKFAAAGFNLVLCARRSALIEKLAINLENASFQLWSTETSMNVFYPCKHDFTLEIEHIDKPKIVEVFLDLSDSICPV